MSCNPKKRGIVLAFSVGMVLGLVFTSVSYTAWCRCDDKNTIRYFAAAQAKLIAYNVTCSLSFLNNKDANSILDSLKLQNYVAFAGVYDSNGRLFAYHYRNDVRQNGFIPPHPARLNSKNLENYLVITEPIIVDHNFFGTVILLAQP